MKAVHDGKDSLQLVDFEDVIDFSLPIQRLVASTVGATPRGSLARKRVIEDVWLRVKKILLSSVSSMLVSH